MPPVSRNHTTAALPSQPSAKVTTTVKTSALRGVPRRASSRASPAGSSPARAMATTTRDVAMNSPRKLVSRPRIAMANAPHPSTGKPAALNASIVPSFMPATSSHGMTHALDSRTRQ